MKKANAAASLLQGFKPVFERGKFRVDLKPGVDSGVMHGGHHEQA